ncbi:MAG: hypothetical protein JSW47_08425, partial [Phycisphaerales bacterium]
MRRNIPGFVSVMLLVFLPAGPAFAPDGDPHLVGHWQLDGSANDGAGGNHGTLVGDPTWVSDPVRGWCLD